MAAPSYNQNAFNIFDEEDDPFSIKQMLQIRPGGLPSGWAPGQPDPFESQESPFSPSAFGVPDAPANLGAPTSADTAFAAAPGTGPTTWGGPTTYANIPGFDWDKLNDPKKQNDKYTPALRAFAAAIGSQGLKPTSESLSAIAAYAKANGFPNASVAGKDTIDFGDGRGPVDVIRDVGGPTADWQMLQPWTQGPDTGGAGTTGDAAAAAGNWWLNPTSPQWGTPGATKAGSVPRGAAPPEALNAGSIPEWSEARRENPRGRVPPPEWSERRESGERGRIGPPEPIIPPGPGVAPPSGDGPASPMDPDALYQLLMSRALQGLDVGSNDPVVRQQADAFNANQDRASRAYLQQVAEQEGPNANISAERRSTAERAGQAGGEFEAQAIGNEIAARRQEIQQALAAAPGLLTAQQAINLQRELAQLDMAYKYYSTNLSNEQFGRGLEQRESEFGRGLGWDQSRFGQELGWEQNRFGQELDWQRRQFGQSLEWEREQFGSTLAERARQFNETNSLTREQMAQAMTQFRASLDQQDQQFYDSLTTQEKQFFAGLHQRAYEFDQRYRMDALGL